MRRRRLTPLFPYLLFWDEIHPTTAGHEILGYRAYALLAPVVTGDMDCDGNVDFDDISPFVLALTNPAAYESTMGVPADLKGDTDGDGDLDFDDIDDFVAILNAPLAEPLHRVPEPPALPFAVIGLFGLVVWKWRKPLPARSGELRGVVRDSG